MSILSLDHEITFFDECKSLGTSMNPVYLLRAEDDSVIVIKREQDTVARQDLKFNLKVVKAVQPVARGKVLTQQEIKNLKTCIGIQKIACRVNALPEDMRQLDDHLNGHGTWFKMKEVKELTTLKAAVQALKASKGPIRKFAQALNAQGGLETLGEVVAVDMYNHNTDRFSPRLKDAIPPVYDTEERNGMGLGDLGNMLKCRVLLNMGNVMIGLDGDRLKPVALDAFDPYSQLKDVSKTVDQLENGTLGECWFGRLLAPTPAAKGLRELYAKDIVDDLEDVWGPRNRRLPFLRTRRLDRKAPRRIVTGMELARVKIIQKLEALMRKYGNQVPAGLQSRYDILTKMA